jgi:electron transport complex protein RnfB
MKAPQNPEGKKPTRREFLRSLFRYVSLGGLAALAGSLAAGRGGIRRRFACTVCSSCPGEDPCPLTRPAPLPPAPARHVWQIDPARCVQCGGCALNCVLNPSAVKCVHAFSMCGYCKLCFGYFQPGAPALTADAENQLCPVGAIRRRFVEDPYHEYTIDESLCVGCGKCVKGCAAFGNGSLFLQVRHDVCVNCNECSIARNCPTQAFRRVPADQPYLLKGRA